MAQQTLDRPGSPGNRDVARPRWVEAVRTRVVRVPFGLIVWRIAIGVIGLAIVAGGIVMLPLPGPGWLVIFLGIGAWATEFRWAGRLLHWVKDFAAAWTARIKAMPVWAKVLIGLGVLVLLGGLGYGGWALYRSR